MTKTIDKVQKTTAIPNEERLCQSLLFILLLFITLCATAADYTDDAIRTLLPFDAIPAITDPQFVSTNDAKLDADAPVIGVTFNDESHAYSLYLLNGHEIVNDVVGGLKIATTW
jgi:hypothetical protein